VKVLKAKWTLESCDELMRREDQMPAPELIPAHDRDVAVVDTVIVHPRVLHDYQLARVDEIITVRLCAAKIAEAIDAA
jgi:hypothetical protein